MVLYTPQATNVDDPFGAAILSDEALRILAYRLLEEANQSFLESDVIVRLHLVHVAPFDLPETGDVEADRVTLAGRADVQTLRDAYGADIVMLIEGRSTVPGGPVGSAFMPLPAASPAHSESAYGVVIRSAADWDLAFTHEIGHIFGADHDCAAPDVSSNAGFNHGYDQPMPTAPPLGSLTVHPWRTVMSTDGTLQHLARWSNPNQFLPAGSSDALGVLAGGCDADDHSTLNTAAKYVANYRCSSPERDDVWMKDTWGDTGTEPLPASESPIYDSPYLWVRNTQDNERIHQHEHQDPELGSRNWVYVKLHNGADTDQDGHLELYWADSSTNIGWPSGWTLLESVPVVGFPAHSTQIVETPWDHLPGVGDSYCLIARWNSPADPMSVPETNDIAANVRNSNNLIWKNLKIVDLVAGLDIAEAHFIVRTLRERVPDLEELLHLSLVVPPAPGPDPASFLVDGQVRVEFDDVLMQAWELGGRKGSGFRPDGAAFLLTGHGETSFSDLLMPPGTQGRVTVRFQRTNKTANRTYRVDFEQRSQNRLVGGVRYEIRCAARPQELPAASR